MKKIYLYTLLFMCVLNAACTDDYLYPAEEYQTPLKVNVRYSGFSRALIEKDYFNVYASIGVKLVNSGTTDDYTAATSFLQYNHSGSTSGSNPYDYDGWNLYAGSAYLGGKPATIYAYYPYDSEKKDFSSIPVESGQTDYMYGQSIEDVNAINNYGMIHMQHALAAVRVSVKRGTATKKKISSVALQGTSIMNTGMLNVFTGTIDEMKGGGPVVVNYSSALSLSTSFQNTDFAVIPSGGSAPLSIIFVDTNGIESKVTTEAIRLQAGCLYTVEVTVDFGGVLTVDKIKMDDWTYISSDDASFNVDGYTIHCTGNLSGIALHKTVDNGTVSITAAPKLSYATVNPVTVIGTASVSQKESSDIIGVRHINLSEISSDMTITFDGVTEHPAIGTIDLSTAADGVYAVTKDKKGVNLSEADESCIAVALVHGTHRFMIEKNEYRNAAWAGQTYLFGCYTSFVWPSRFTTIDGTNTTAYLPQANGGSYSTPVLSADYTTWTSGALSDFNGENNTVGIIENSANPRDMGLVLQTFNSDSSQNQSYEDWYIPSLGELALIYLNLQQVNEMLEKISGIPLNDIYLTSTEYSQYNLWYVCFIVNTSGKISNDSKNKNSSVRFIRRID